jgi:hypothetical protein
MNNAIYVSLTTVKTSHLVSSTDHVFVIVVNIDGRDYVSELWPPTGLFFTPEMIYEFGEPRWNVTDGKTEELREKAVPVPHYPPIIPHGLTQA